MKNMTNPKNEQEIALEAIRDAAYEVTEMATDAADEKRLTRLVARVLADVYGGKPSTFRAAIEDSIDDRGRE